MQGLLWEDRPTFLARSSARQPQRTLQSPASARNEGTFLSLWAFQVLEISRWLSSVLSIYGPLFLHVFLSFSALVPTLISFRLAYPGFGLFALLDYNPRPSQMNPRPVMGGAAEGGKCGTAQDPPVALADEGWGPGDAAGPTGQTDGVTEGVLSVVCLWGSGGDQVHSPCGPVGRVPLRSWCLSSRAVQCPWNLPGT